MALRRIVIAIPEDLLAAVDGAAGARGETRSRFVTTVLQEAVRANSDAEITTRLNRLFAEPDLAAEQSRTTQELDALVTEWSDERW